MRKFARGDKAHDARVGGLVSADLQVTLSY